MLRLRSLAGRLSRWMTVGSLIVVISLLSALGAHRAVAAVSCTYTAVPGGARYDRNTTIDIPQGGFLMLQADEICLSVTIPGEELVLPQLRLIGNFPIPQVNGMTVTRNLGTLWQPSKSFTVRAGTAAVGSTVALPVTGLLGAPFTLTFRVVAPPPTTCVFTTIPGGVEYRDGATVNLSGNLFLSAGPGCGTNFVALDDGDRNPEDVLAHPNILTRANRLRLWRSGRMIGISRNGAAANGNSYVRLRASGAGAATATIRIVVPAVGPCTIRGTVGGRDQRFGNGANVTLDVNTGFLLSETCGDDIGVFTSETIALPLSPPPAGLWQMTVAGFTIRRPDNDNFAVAPPDAYGRSVRVRITGGTADDATFTFRTAEMPCTVFVGARSYSGNVQELPLTEPMVLDFSSNCGTAMTAAADGAAPSPFNPTTAGGNFMLNLRNNITVSRAGRRVTVTPNTSPAGSTVAITVTGGSMGNITVPLRRLSSADCTLRNFVTGRIYGNGDAIDVAENLELIASSGCGNRARVLGEDGNADQMLGGLLPVFVQGRMQVGLTLSGGFGLGHRLSVGPMGVGAPVSARVRFGNPGAFGIGATNIATFTFRIPAPGEFGGCRVEKDLLGAPLAVAPAVTNFDTRSAIIVTKGSCQENIVVRGGDAEHTFTFGAVRTMPNGITVERSQRDAAANVHVFEVSYAAALRNQQVEVEVRARTGESRRYAFRFEPPAAPAGVPPPTVTQGETVQHPVPMHSTLAVQDAVGRWVTVGAETPGVHGLNLSIQPMLKIEVLPTAAMGERRIRINGEERVFTVVAAAAECQVIGFPEELTAGGDPAIVRLVGDCEPVTVRNPADGSTDTVGDVTDEPRQGDEFTVVRTSPPQGVPVETEIRIAAMEGARAGDREIIIERLTQKFRIVGGAGGDCFMTMPPNPARIPSAHNRDLASGDPVLLRFSPGCDPLRVDIGEVDIPDGGAPVVRPSGFRAARAGRDVTLTPGPRSGQWTAVGRMQGDVRTHYSFTRVGAAEVDCRLGDDNRCVALVIHAGEAPICTRDVRYDEVVADAAFVRRKFFLVDPPDTPRARVGETSMAACRGHADFRAAEAARPPRADGGGGPRPDGRGPPPACIRAGEACNAGGPACCDPGRLHCARRAEGGEGTFCLGAAVPAPVAAGGGFVGGRLTAGSPCTTEIQCSGGRMIRPYLTCGPDGTCCMNDPRGGNGCWDNLTGAMQIAWQTFHIGQVTGTPQFQFCARGGAHPLCPQIAGKLQFHQQIMSKLMGGP